MQPQPFADVLSLPVSIVSSYNWDYKVHKAYNIFIQLFAKRKFADSCPKGTESHRAQWWKDNARQSGEKSRHVRGEEGCTEGMLRGRGGGRRCAEKDNGAHKKRSWPARPPKGEVRPEKAAHPILWNHFQKRTDLSASPGMCRILPETSVQLCMPGWSRVPGEKMLSGKTLGSVLGKQRQTHGRESQGGWMRGNPLPPGLYGHMSHQRAHLWLPGGLPGGGGTTSLLESILHVTLKLLLTPTFTLKT